MARISFMRRGLQAPCPWTGGAAAGLRAQTDAGGRPEALDAEAPRRHAHLPLQNGKNQGMVTSVTMPTTTCKGRPSRKKSEKR